MKNVAGMMQDYFKQHQDKIDWNSKGELIYCGEAIL